MAYIRDVNEAVAAAIKAARTRKKPRVRGDRDAAMGARVSHAVGAGGGFTRRDFERTIGRNDLLPVNYLERGTIAARSVGRISAVDGHSRSWGTGFLVAPGLLLTNNHVIATAEAAGNSTVEFNYQRDATGRFGSSRHFSLEPERAFITSDANDLDYTLVAVAPLSNDGTATIASFGFLRLFAGTHKVEEHEYVTVIQHPSGDEKYIAVRENKIVQIGDGQTGLPDNRLWYVSDTAPGSSGAPAFNDDWQVVALHHMGIPMTRKGTGGRTEYKLTSGEWVSEERARQLPEDALLWRANEGIRISSLIADLRSRNSSASPIRALVDDIDGIRPLTGQPRESIVVTGPDAAIAGFEARRPRRRVHDLSYYSGREGYQPGFLGQPIPLPELTDKALSFGAAADILGGGNELKYEHFSVVFNATRRLAFFTAVNIDGGQSVELDRGGSDTWYFDPRLPESLQVGDDFYGNEPGGNYFDRGHLVRRLDPVWGDPAMCARANEDTFHWANCSPQYFAFNQGAALWQGLENFILGNTDSDDLKATVFTGPVFAADDAVHRGVPVPQAYWKVVVVADVAGRLFSSAYVVSQKQWAKTIPFERMPVGQHNGFQVSIADLEQRTGLRFSPEVRGADVGKALAEPKPLRSLADIEHPRRSAAKPYGTFPSFEAFLESYLRRRDSGLEAEFPAAVERRRQKRERDVVEVNASVIEYNGEEGNSAGRHQHLIIAVTNVLVNDPDIAADLARVQQGQERVFVSIRYGDRMGLPKPVPNLAPGLNLHLKGEWIPREVAYSHGGEDLSVLHFTHHPLGFVCTPAACYD